MNVLLLGGNGFIGSYISDWMIRNNHHVRVVDKYPERFRAPSKNIDYRYLDINSTHEVMEAMHEIDIVFHLISSTVPCTSNFDIFSDINQNLIESLRVLDLLVKTKVKKIVYFSTGGAIYGSPETIPIPETHATNPVSSYGIVKLTMEKYLHLYSLDFGLKPLIIRPSNPYGPRQGHLAVQGVIAAFLLKLLKDEEMVVWGDGNIVRDYIFIEDFIELTCQLVIKDSEGIYNIGSNVGISINQILDIIRKITNKNLKVNYQPPRSIDIVNVVLDNTKIYKILPQLRLTSIENGIEIFWKWLNFEKDRFK